jgi:ADP-ribose pyrophosphatase YjhB (NUDIX family)
MSTRWKPNVTVAAIIEREGRFMLVEEHTSEGLRLNNPAGHLDCGETPEQACAREALEETAHAFIAHGAGRRVPVPRAACRDRGRHHVPAFCLFRRIGAFDAQRPLDDGIVRTLWMTPEEVRSSAARHRSPLVLRCIEDHLAGQRFPLSLIHADVELAT